MKIVYFIDAKPGCFYQGVIPSFILLRNLLVSQSLTLLKICHPPSFFRYYKLIWITLSSLYQAPLSFSSAYSQSRLVSCTLIQTGYIHHCFIFQSNPKKVSITSKTYLQKLTGKGSTHATCTSALGMNANTRSLLIRIQNCTEMRQGLVFS